MWLVSLSFFCLVGVFVLVVDVVGVELRLKRIAHNLLSERPTPRDINLMISRHVYQAKKEKLFSSFLNAYFVCVLVIVILIRWVHS